MNTHPDFEELFRLLEENRVDYMIVGGYAVAFHGYPRFTKDIDIYFDAAAANVSRLRSALVAFGFQPENLPEDVFFVPGNMITFGVAPTRVDLLNRIDGVQYADAKVNVVRGMYGNVAVTFIGRGDLVTNKRSTLRDQDRVGAKELEN